MLRKVSDDATKEGYILIKYIVQGGTKLSGSVTISGAKNAAVAILPATLLVSGPCRIENVPDISDVRLLLEILRDMGAEIHRYGRNTLEIDCSRARAWPLRPRPRRHARRLQLRRPPHRPAYQGL